MGTDNQLKRMQSDFPMIRLKFGVDRKIDKIEEVSDDLPVVSLDMVESWTGTVSELSDGTPKATTGLVSFQQGDVLFSKLRPYLAKAFQAEFEGAGSPEFLVLEPKEFESRYLLYLLLSKEVIDRVDASTYGAKMPRASWDFIGSLKVPAPDMRTQRQIVQFLDEKCGYIDSLIKQKEKLLDLIEERRVSLITNAVTGNQPAKGNLVSTDIPWFDSLPSHWTPIKTKYVLWGIEQGWSPQCNEVPSGPNQWGVLKAGAVNNMEFDPKENKELPDELEVKNELIVRQGDVLMSRANTRELVGSCARVHDEPSQLLICDKLYRLQFRESMCDPDYFVYAANSAPSREQIELDASGASSSMVNISQEFVEEMIIPLPPLDEQKSIVRYLDEMIGDLKDLKEATEKGIRLLHQKRRSLIASAVTGEIDCSKLVKLEGEEIRT